MAWSTTSGIHFKVIVRSSVKPGWYPKHFFEDSIANAPPAVCGQLHHQQAQTAPKGIWVVDCRLLWTSTYQLASQGGCLQVYNRDPHTFVAAGRSNISDVQPLTESYR